MGFYPLNGESNENTTKAEERKQGLYRGYMLRGLGVIGLTSNPNSPQLSSI